LFLSSVDRSSHRLRSGRAARRAARLLPALATLGVAQYCSLDGHRSPQQNNNEMSTMDKHSVELLIARQYSGLLLFFRRKVGDRELADDLVNEAVATALEHLHAGRISQPSQIAGYVFRVAMNHWRNQRRRLGEQPERRTNPDIIEDLAANREGADDCEASELRGRVRGILEELPARRDRELVTRFYLNQDEKRDICSDLGIAPLHFDKVIFRARKRMRELLEAKGFKKSDFFGLLLSCLG
jgi:RNA polymerase sigma-70 factor, ECF subfamily